MGQREELEYQALSIIYRSGEPVGSGVLSDKLRRAGFCISEATAGRILRELDAAGLTVRSGFRGRCLTEQGQERLLELEQKRIRFTYEQEFIKAVRARSKQDLIDLLIARRAIERETARLCAIHATEKDINRLKEVMLRQKDHAKDGVVAADDVEFHRIIAEASGNKVLLAAVDLIRQDGQITPVLEHIRREVKSTVAADHETILSAIEERDPKKAETSMVTHIENIIADVEKYWRVAEEEGRDAS